MDGATVRPESPARGRDPAHPLALWAAVLGGPVAVLAGLEALYLLVPWSCRNASWPLHAAALTAALLVLGAFAIAWRGWRRAAGGWPGDADGSEERARFLGLVGMLLAALSFGVVIAQWIPVFVLHPCLGAG